MNRPRLVLKASCPDRVGVVAAVTGFLAGRDALIMELSHFVDEDAQKSFLRVDFEDDAGDAAGRAALSDAFDRQVAARLGMSFEFHAGDQRMRTLVAVSRQGHCLNALLHQWRDGHLPIDITGIVSNHEALQRLTDWYEIPFHHFPIEDGDRAAQESRILELFEDSGSELLVLARYMQILSPDACARLAGRAINIHHSFLPGFKGARPYHQAFRRGVKLIGATAHYVTNELDEGPIIEQDVVRVNHAERPGELERLGQDVESTVLARAVRWHAQHRVFEHDHRTIIMRH
jgi:formyltetrahydrofolate deformylase